MCACRVTIELSRKSLQEWGLFSLPERDEVTMSLAMVSPAPILNAQTRCDSCRSRAYAVVILHRSVKLPYSGELLFCAHCYKKHLDALAPYVAQVIDERATLTQHIKDDGHIN